MNANAFLSFFFSSPSSSCFPLCGREIADIHFFFSTSPSLSSSHIVAQQQGPGALLRPPLSRLDYRIRYKGEGDRWKRVALVLGLVLGVVVRRLEERGKEEERMDGKAPSSFSSRGIQFSPHLTLLPPLFATYFFSLYVL